MFTVEYHGKSGKSNVCLILTCHESSKTLSAKVKRLNFGGSPTLGNLKTFNLRETTNAFSWTELEPGGNKIHMPIFLPPGVIPSVSFKIARAATASRCYRRSSNTAMVPYKWRFLVGNIICKWWMFYYQREKKCPNKTCSSYCEKAVFRPWRQAMWLWTWLNLEIYIYIYTLVYIYTYIYNDIMMLLRHSCWCVESL